MHRLVEYTGLIIAVAVLFWIASKITADLTLGF
ncbi:hypothetical protein ABIE08_002296 [Kaistia defluvii]|uniref:Uncharacterized protein n=1 Tax=Kaistia defluvii TaxID=410841 RepID=A0ABV2QZD6_9HYPH